MRMAPLPSPIWTEAAEGTAAKVAEVEAALKDGSLHVFDTSKFTVDGKEVTSCPVDLTYYDFSTGSPVAVYQGETKELSLTVTSMRRAASCPDVLSAHRWHHRGR